MARLVVVFSKSKGKIGYIETRTGNHCDWSSKGRKCSGVLPTGFGNYDFHGVCTVTIIAGQLAELV